MAMAELLVVMFEGGRTTWQDICQPKDDFRKKICIVTGSRRVGDDGRHVDQKVTMLKLEQVFFQVERVEDVILDCDLDIVINDDGDVDRMMSFTVRFNRWS